MFEDIHLDNNPLLKETLGVMNFIFAVTFTVEMLLKILGMGFVGYFSNLWNCLDCFIVAVRHTNIPYYICSIIHGSNMPQKPELSAGLMGLLARMQTLPFYLNKGCPFNSQFSHSPD